MTAAPRWQGLLQQNPFVPFEPPKPPPPEPPPPYEFRGRSVEAGVEYFTLYNLETKKALWVSRTAGNLRVENYSPATGLVLMDQNGRKMHLTPKSPPQWQGGARIAAGATQTAALGKTFSPALAVPLSSSEAQRLEQAAAEIRARRASRQQAASRG